MTVDLDQDKCPYTFFRDPHAGCGLQLICFETITDMLGEFGELSPSTSRPVRGGSQSMVSFYLFKKQQPFNLLVSFKTVRSF